MRRDRFRAENDPEPLLTMKTHFTDPYVPPVTKDQLKAAGKDPDCLYWSPDFRCWRLSGDWIRPYATTGLLLAELGLEINPKA